MESTLVAHKECKSCGAQIDPQYEVCYNCKQKSFSKPKESEGEEFLGDFFDNIGFRYEKQYKVTGLKGDSKQYRVADFKLIDYNVLVEYDGQWHVDRDRYSEKKRVYKQNGKACIYLYPENLGAIHFFFDRRLIVVLKDFGLNRELKKYRWYKMRKGEGKRLGYTVLLILVFFALLADPQTEWFWFLFPACGVLYQIVSLYQAYRDIFVKDRYPISDL